MTTLTCEICDCEFDHLDVRFCPECHATLCPNCECGCEEDDED